ncbi:YkgJ family cysteine cluster protein [Pelotalea chapellei]|uniref:YkgJ family cysteine cluster protein n=1 Tax=Pelotalea chapellei TaxID=44671 RepID=A0ABS5U9W7_9BACT|nr:YkgJ family cysteine cluster protein [Pelotalea chapellei]MBT1072428.1 YkgJ family cysteine cluster protein [Pelotalea chapellei]
MEPLLENYRQLVARVDALCQEIESILGKSITCSAGCSSCCTSISIFPVEAAALASGLKRLSAEDAATIHNHVTQAASGERCPLLHNNHCLLYQSRPIICRTHGLPILFMEEGQQRVDCCPRNDLEHTELTGSTVIDLERLNSVLVAVNALFISQTGAAAQSSERVTIAEAIEAC